MIFEHRDYRTFLKTTLSAKAKVQEGYSLRAFSERIGISASFLSEVLNAKKGLSVELAFRLAINLDLTESETQYFCLLVQLEQEKDPLFREKLSRRLADLNPHRPAHDLSADLFKSISEWYHAAILELTYLPGQKLSAELAARSLGISKADAELAIERLLRLALLEKDAAGNLTKNHNYVHAESTVPTGAFREFHGQVLGKASAALQAFPPSERMSASDVIAIDSKNLNKVDRLSREFSAAVMKLAEKSKAKDSVYALSVHFFPLAKHEGRFQ
ncbi:MAG: TIGR02147 family protein [Proteobacteria bacterium]|nr:MAG: TIGR02147 family protein [Pseudomonadota bacterium]